MQEMAMGFWQAVLILLFMIVYGGLGLFLVASGLQDMVRKWRA